MANLRAIVRATQARALALKSLSVAARKLRDAERNADPRAALAASRAMSRAKSRADRAGAVLHSNPLPGDL